MTKYTSLGQLLTDFRAFKKLSQADLGALLDVDSRTIIRWEKNTSLLKADKEEELAEVTFIPYQVIRNLNAPVALPTYYDFSLRKYANNELFTSVPHADWLKSLLPLNENQIVLIQHKRHVDLISKCLVLQGKDISKLKTETLLKAGELLPELNFILMDNANFYSGHCLFLPLKQDIYQLIKGQELHPLEITPNHLVSPKEKEAMFFALDLNADCNENLFRLSAPIRSFFTQQPNGYLYASFTSRPDTDVLNRQFGNELIWESQHEWDSKPVKLFEKDTRK